ncbi:hypothetical protein GCM10009092_45780 [Bowmanella denitrificans]|uniref:HPt domain-containing protein n=1 Tax=Bowmanella denitrificans TaxID=366582 RepID=A0ABP3HQK1_9ALTE
MAIDLSKLSRHVGDISSEDEQDLLSTFHSGLILRHQDVVNAVKQRDWQRLKTLTHSLKSSSLYYGAKQLHLCCEQGEQLAGARQLDLDVIQDWLVSFTKHSQAAQHALAEALEQLEAGHDRT